MKKLAIFGALCLICFTATMVITVNRLSIRYDDYKLEDELNSKKCYERHGTLDYEKKGNSLYCVMKDGKVELIQE